MWEPFALISVDRLAPRAPTFDITYSVTAFLFQPPKKDAKPSAKQPQKTQKKKEGSGGGKAKKKVTYLHRST